MKISQKIIDYAIWYYLRYYPSTRKLEQKLRYKFGPESENGKKYGGLSQDEIHYITQEKLSNIIQEREVCSSKIKHLIGKSKNLRYIKNNLRQKLFENDLIEDILKNDFHYHENSLFHTQKLSKKIQELQQKGKSIQYVKNTFIEREVDRETVETLIGEIFLEGDITNLQREYDKLVGKYEKQKIIEKLLRKGFYYGDIKQLFDARI